MRTLPSMDAIRDLQSLSANHKHAEVEAKLRAHGCVKEADDYADLRRQIEDLEGEAFGITDDLYFERKKIDGQSVLSDEVVRMMERPE